MSRPRIVLPSVGGTGRGNARSAPRGTRRGTGRCSGRGTVRGTPRGTGRGTERGTVRGVTHGTLAECDPGFEENLVQPTVRPVNLVDTTTTPNIAPVSAASTPNNSADMSILTPHTEADDSHSTNYAAGGGISGNVVIRLKSIDENELQVHSVENPSSLHKSNPQKRPSTEEPVDLSVSGSNDDSIPQKVKRRRHAVKEPNNRVLRNRK